MSQDIRIKKGLDLNLVGSAEQAFQKEVSSSTFGFYFDDFHAFVPKLYVKEGAEVKAGEPLFYDKNAPEIQFASPVSGELVAIERGDRRKILSIRILADKDQQYLKHQKLLVNNASREEVLRHFLNTGLWPFIKQRPFDLIADPKQTPKAIFVSGLNTGPLNTDLDFVLKGSEDKLQAALSALKKLTPGAVHVTVASKNNSVFSNLENIVLHEINQLHPAGLVGTQIAHIDPINKGEVVWVVGAQDLVIIGELLLTGQFNAARSIAVTGSRVKSPKYIKTKIGAELGPIFEAIGVQEGNNRFIAGDVLTGSQVKPEEHLRYYATQLTVIPEGNDYEFFGWNKPVFNKVSPTRALTFSWLNKKKAYDLNTNTNGEHRAFVVTGSYEEVFPLDIYPMQLLKACMVKDLDEMEQLGLYEVVPEDFALTEFICISKQSHQAIIREGLDVLKQELG